MNLNSMKTIARWLVLCWVVLASATAMAQAPSKGLNLVDVRGKPQKVYFYPGIGNGTHQKVLFAPGDGGWHGFAVYIAKALADSGYDVYGLDTRIYLQSVASENLSVADVGSDFRQIAKWVRQKSENPVMLIGWSEGAGLGIGALGDQENHKIFAGIIAIGTTEYNILAWRWSDLGAEILKTPPHEPTFKTVDYIQKISPLPLAMIASTHDEYIALESVMQLFDAAKDPKILYKVEASDHKFQGNEGEFFAKLKEAATWILQQHR
jgi:hypothetical protein